MTPTTQAELLASLQATMNATLALRDALASLGDANTRMITAISEAQAEIVGTAKNESVGWVGNVGRS